MQFVTCSVGCQLRVIALSYTGTELFFLFTLKVCMGPKQIFTGLGSVFLNKI